MAEADRQTQLQGIIIVKRGGTEITQPRMDVACAWATLALSNQLSPDGPKI